MTNELFCVSFGDDDGNSIHYTLFAYDADDARSKARIAVGNSKLANQMWEAPHQWLKHRKTKRIIPTGLGVVCERAHSFESS